MSDWPESSFEENGFAIIDHLLPPSLLGCLRGDVIALIGALLEREGISVTRGLDISFNSLCRIDRKLGGYIFDVVRELPSYLDVIRSPVMLEYLRMRFGWEMVHLPYGLTQLRIDRPGEDKFAFPWHQDYPYNMMSQSAVTWWVPLTDITKEMGPLRVVPGSHKRGIHPVYAATAYEPGAAGQADNRRIYALKDPDIAGFECEAIDVPVGAGQALMLHSLLLHRSGLNRSADKNRWTVIFRTGDLLAPEVVARGWQIARPNKPGTMAGFHKWHPELATIRDAGSASRGGPDQAAHDRGASRTGAIDGAAVR